MMHRIRIAPAVRTFLGTAVAAAGMTVLAPVAQAAGLKIGFSQVTLQSPFYVQLKEGAEAAARAGGDELILLDANGDVNKQNNDIQDLLTRKVDVLIINPVNPDAVQPALAAAKRNGVPVITVDRSVNGDGPTAHLGRDNLKMGRVVGEAVLAELKKKGLSRGKVIEIQGDAGGTVMAARRDGFHAALKNSGFKIVAGPYAEYTRANAVTAMQDLLQAHPDVNLVYAHNDDMAMGALKVLTEAGKQDVYVAGVDGLSEALASMSSGGQYLATALNDPRYLGDMAVQTAREISAGKKVPAFVDAGTRAVTRANVAEFKRTGLFAEYRPAVFK
ncbi:sugar ABC transporter substrate-binding protein [Verminephrobacter aporrectodeae subsp. tuberculatae]|uniref:substrate-binding domain-containing protein n=1 Tax=Verminephrobacter aporrectodeae TaxID=1110389 RepID=UPI002243498F|nr:substrate-binding domain-containing protein [Verminephrobacter aporrectodeae]MCW8208406.1 sugar ABC transporter substrate-binding protein [Verminephrobacter aporrectodeae subsp. tuberculatae]